MTCPNSEKYKDACDRILLSRAKATSGVRVDSNTILQLHYEKQVELGIDVSNHPYNKDK